MSSFLTPREPEIPPKGALFWSGQVMTNLEACSSPTFLQQAMPHLSWFYGGGSKQMWQLKVCVVAAFTPWRLLCNKNDNIWNKTGWRLLLELPTTFGNEVATRDAERLLPEITTTFGHEDTSRNATRLLLETSTTFGIEYATSNATRWLIEIAIRTWEWGQN